MSQDDLQPDASSEDKKLSDFDVHFQNWAENFAKGKNKKVKWVDAYGKDERNENSENRVEIVIGKITYLDPIVDEKKPGYTFEQVFHNGGSQVLTGKFSHTKTQKSSFNWTLNKSLSVGMGLEFKPKIPSCFGEFGVNFETSLSVDTNEEQSEEKEESYTIENEIPIPPQKSLKAIFTIYDEVVEIPWEAEVTITGNVVVCLETLLQKKLYFPVVGDLEGDEFVREGDSLRFKIHGVFKGNHGVETNLRTEELELQEGDQFQ